MGRFANLLSEFISSNKDAGEVDNTYIYIYWSEDFNLEYN